MSTSADFDVTTETMPGGAVVLHVTGELDLATAPRVEAAISASGGASHLIIDLSQCTFLDSSGVRVLANAGRQLPEGGRVDLVAVDQGVLRTLELTGIDTVIPVHPSVESAL